MNNMLSNGRIRRLPQRLICESGRGSIVDNRSYLGDIEAACRTRNPAYQSRRADRQPCHVPGRAAASRAELGGWVSHLS